MSGTVKPRRRYDSRRRQAQAAQTRRDIVEAAQEVFLEHGYEATTMAGIAQSAGVVVETIYRSFGGKAQLFKAVVEAAVAGGADRATIPIEQRPAIQAIIAERDPYRQLERYAATQPGIHARIGPLFRVLAAAAVADSELAEVLDQMENQRLAGMEEFVKLLATRKLLRPGMSVVEARDVLWTIASHAVHDLLVVNRGWSPDRYRDWLVKTLTAALLPERRQAGRRSVVRVRPQARA